ncbi:MAG: Ferredoxin thioredoxin reductase catalytic beta chain [Candidatus Methanofastidiosum methylothiophilum]|jgi:ferredoxin-thioredoxin reductase catalytic subunit|uniref:ferredoxin:thioredoxin reductase n=1 Tax=Candidatus Methanofastidiosum methylothiophilum TaxID=1705564 RepID=A0A150JD16_9EURY|nr:MAG: Ferredoxin thioredoxin reductase catalytic beta chain [Candidatus Methanofastidiosum methylthiophilus]OQC51609.1 MAG: Ferredoxin thioredoxin reductase catalytic beta chain [Euryarchaeota archaeon ADurb.Bin023]HNV94008.1 ferredoxin-thioredoxin reductase catalytic domain-containing protein [Methanofastidiosum sp.]KYC57437.1 MAG: Ferredoxin thioredoxin reductase catalytic beta chain [Candidatus Methanofastidiosum methylthiophilus]KYC58223.1 MAG: Ferredoxin thioredoxin reductase catalytic b
MYEDMPEERINIFYEKLKKDAEAGGYQLNPDTNFTKKLVKGLLVNQDRYNYQACPCRISSGIKDADLDIICPCDYRDPDLDEYGTCYCALYVSQDILNGKKELVSIPDRRPTDEERMKQKENKIELISSLKYPIWRCKVCGYLCARDEPPEICPICKAKKDRFEKFL